MITRHKKARRGPRDLMAISQAAEYLAVHSNTLRNWANKGIIKSYRLGTRGDRRFSLDDLLGLLKSYGLEAPSDHDDQNSERMSSRRTGFIQSKPIPDPR